MWGIIIVGLAVAFGVGVCVGRVGCRGVAFRAGVYVGRARWCGRLCRLLLSVWASMSERRARSRQARAMPKAQGVARAAPDESPADPLKLAKDVLRGAGERRAMGHGVASAAPSTGEVLSRARVQMDRTRRRANSESEGSPYGARVDSRPFRRDAVVGVGPVLGGGGGEEITSWGEFTEMEMALIQSEAARGVGSAPRGGVVHDSDSDDSTLRQIADELHFEAMWDAAGHPHPY